MGRNERKKENMITESKREGRNNNENEGKKEGE